MIDLFSIEEKINIIGVNPNTIYIFKNTEYGKNAPAHYHISIPISDENSLLLVATTSQIEKKEQYYGRNANLSAGLLKLNIGELDFVKKECLIDCNQPLFQSKEELKNIILNGEITFLEEINIPEFIEDIKSKIKNSSLVKPNIKNLLK